MCQSGRTVRVLVTLLALLMAMSGVPEIAVADVASIGEDDIAEVGEDIVEGEAIEGETIEEEAIESDCDVASELESDSKADDAHVSDPCPTPSEETEDAAEIGFAAELPHDDGEEVQAQSAGKPSVNVRSYRGTYDGFPHTPTVSCPSGTVLYRTGTPWSLDMDAVLQINKYRLGKADSYTVMPSQTNAGTLTVYYLAYLGSGLDAIESINKYRLGSSQDCDVIVGSVTATVDTCPITDCNVTLSSTSFTYDGSAKRPAVTVKRGSRVLTSGVDYNVSYSKNASVGTATVTIKGIGNYKGSKKVTFQISARAISKASVSGINASYTYTGSAIKPTPTVKYGSTTLKKDIDYTLKYSANTKVGTATIAITGKGTYAGTKKVTFKVVRRSVAKATVSSINNKTYTGKAIKPKPTIKVSGRTLVSGTDYKLSYTNNTKPGTATVTIRGIGNYSGTRKVTFKIVGPSISGNGWKIALPSYWLGKTTVQKSPYLSDGYTVYPQRSATGYPVLSVYVLSNSDSVNYLLGSGSATVGTVKLKGGRKVTARMGDDGWFFFMVSLGGGRYLSVDTGHYEQRRVIEGGYGPSRSDLATLADLQSLGKLNYTSYSDYRVPLACLKEIAKRTTIS